MTTFKFLVPSSPVMYDGHKTIPINCVINDYRNSTFITQFTMQEDDKRRDCGKKRSTTTNESCVTARCELFSAVLLTGTKLADSSLFWFSHELSSISFYLQASYSIVCVNLHFVLIWVLIEWKWDDSCCWYIMMHGFSCI